jgi:multidrug transporter EmrE-like cation transporter
MKTATSTDFVYIALTILLTVYGQLVFKWQIDLAGGMPDAWSERLGYFVRLLLNVWVITSFAAGFVASLTWAAALAKFDLSYAYPFTSLAYVLVLVASAPLFREALTLPKLLGVGLIVVGVYVGSRG